MNSITKKCNKCGLIKSLDCFTVAPKRESGRHSICKSCKSEYDRIYREKNKSRISEKQSEYWKANKEKIKISFSDWYAKNFQKVKETNNKWKEKNLLKVSLYQKEWRAKNEKSLKEYQRKYREDNREELNKKHLPITHKRRSRIAENGGSYSIKEWLLVCEYYGNKCLKCGATDKKLTVDHVKPTALGGTSNIDNLQPLCQSCNSSKHAKEIDYRFDKGKFAKGLHEDTQS